MGKGAKVKLFDAITALFQTGARGSAPDGDENYSAFLALTGPDEAELSRQREYAPADPIRFVLSISDGPGREAARSIASLEAQTYRHYEIAEDPVRAKGDFVLTLAAGDTLSPDALYHFARRIEAKPGAKLLYADEDCLVDGRRARPILKPVFSEITALSYDLFGAPLVVSKALYDVCASPGMREAPWPGESYAFALRCLARVGSAEHIARVLCTRGEPPGHPSGSEGCAAVESYLKRTAQDCIVSSGLWRGSFHVMAKPKGKEKTAIIIPNRDGTDELRRLLESIEETCAFYEPIIIIADAGSTSERTLKYYEILEKNGAAEIVTSKNAGYSRLCNAAAVATPSEEFLFLVRDAQLFTPDLLGELRAQAARRGVGAVGCMATDANGRLVHAGYTVGLCGAAESPYAGQGERAWEADVADSPRRLRFTDTVRGVSAVSGACMYVRSSVFHSAGGFDESLDREGETLPCGADVELCVRLMRKGLTNVYTPYARVLLHAPLPRIEDAPEKIRMRCYDALRPAVVAGDPYFNPNFSMRSRVPAVKARPEDKPPEKF